MKWGLPKEVSDLRIAQTLVSYTNKDWIQSWMAANWEKNQSVQMIIIIIMWSLIPESSVTAENQMAKNNTWPNKQKQKKRMWVFTT